MITTYGEMAQSGRHICGLIGGRVITSLEKMRDGQVCVWLEDGFLVVSASTPFSDEH